MFAPGDRCPYSPTQAPRVGIPGSSVLPGFAFYWLRWIAPPVLNRTACAAIPRLICHHARPRT